jgi:hypothetical protein
MSVSANQLRYLALIREAEDLEKLANEATSIFVKEALLESAADYRRRAQVEVGKNE